MPVGAAKLTVGHALQAGLLLAADDRAYFAIFDLRQCCGRQGPLRMLVARLLQRRGPQKAADVISAERGFLSHHVQFLPQLTGRDRYQVYLFISEGTALQSLRGRTIPDSARMVRALVADLCEALQDGNANHGATSDEPAGR